MAWPVCPGFALGQPSKPTCLRRVDGEARVITGPGQRRGTMLSREHQCDERPAAAIGLDIVYDEAVSVRMGRPKEFLANWHATNLCGANRHQRPTHASRTSHFSMLRINSGDF